MSVPSFRLSKADGAWWASGTYKSGRAFRINVGPTSKSREQAEAKAETKLERNVQMGELGKKRWADVKAGKVKQPPASPVALPPPPSEEPDDLDEQLEAAAEHETPHPAPPSSPAPARDHDAIRAKLLAIGDSSVDPDQVIPPGGRRAPVDDDLDDADPVDEETGQLVSEVLAGVAVNAHTRWINRRLKKRKPPHRPGEADEKMLAWEHDGIAFNLNRLIGKAVALGPTGKMLVGLSVVTAQMFLDAEPVEGARVEEAPPAPAPRPSTPAEEPRGSANGVPTNGAAGDVEAKPSTQLSLVPKHNPGLGTFK